MKRSWINGVPGDSVPINDRGLLYGDGVFRTMLIWDGQIVWRDGQVAKLQNDAAMLGLTADSAHIESDVTLALESVDRAVLRYSLTAGDGERGYARTGKAVRRIMQLSDLPQWPASNWRQGVVVESSDVILSAQAALPGIKHLNRLDQILARQRLSAQSTEALLADSDGRVTCAIAGNVFWWDGSVWRTPRIEDCGVAGVAREKLLASFARLGISCQIDSALHLNDLSGVKAMVITNSLLGIWPVVLLNNRVIDTPKCQDWAAVCEAFQHPWVQSFQPQEGRASS